MKHSKTRTAIGVAVVLLLIAGTAMVTENMAPDVPFQQESITRAQQAKEMALACVLFADAHGNQLPKDFEQLKPLLSSDGLPASNWEIVSSGDLNRLTNPAQTILLREKEARKSPRGGFVRTYAFADGHVDRLWSADGNFGALEKKRGFSTQAVAE